MDNIKLSLCSVVCVGFLVLGACSADQMQISSEAKPGMSIVSDIPLPQSAKINLDKSLVMGGEDSWTGKLVYSSNKSKEELVDFVSSQMELKNWVKVSELRGKETVFSFMKNNRIATIVISDGSFLSSKTNVSVGMATSNLGVVRTALITENVVEDKDKS